MQVTVKLHGVFRIDRFKENCAEYPAGIKVKDIVERLQLPEDILGIVLVNDAHGTINDRLHDGDTIALLPILEGG